MLAQIGFKNLDGIVDAAVPKKIRLGKKLNLPAARGEAEALAGLKKIAGGNNIFRSFIGMGFYDCITPAVIQPMFWKTPAGIRNTRRIRQRFHRAGLKRS